MHSRFLRFYDEYRLKCPTYLFAKRYAEQSADKSKLFFCEIMYEMDFNGATYHGLYDYQEVFYIFGTPLLESKKYTQREKEFSQRVVHYWTNFAKYGYN